MIRLFFHILIRSLRQFAMGRPEQIATRKSLFTPQPRAARIIEGEFRRFTARHG